MVKPCLTETQRNVLAWRWTPGCVGRCKSRKKHEEIRLKYNIYIGSWEEDRPCRYTIGWSCANKYCSLCGPTAHSCGDAQNRATRTSYQRHQNKVFRNIVDVPWYIRNAGDCRDLQMEVVTIEIGKFAKKHEDSLHHHPSMSKRSGCLTAVN